MRTLFLAVLLLLSACSKNEQGANEQPNLTIVSSSVVAASSSVTTNTPSSESMPAGKFKLGVSALGMTFDDFLSHFSYDSTEEVEGYLLVSKNGEQLFGLNDKNYLQDRIVRDIVITSPTIDIEGGVRAGMTIQELLAMYPDLLLYMDYHDSSEFFAPPALQKGTSKFPDARIFLNVGQTEFSDNEIALEKNGIYPTEKYSKNGAIGSIVIGLTGNRDSKP